MLMYVECAVSPLEIPNEICLCIYISGCQNSCQECHYPELQSCEYGDPLGDEFIDIMDAYQQQITGVCFMGEGDLSSESRKEFLAFAKEIKGRGLKTALYSGRDVEIEEWMNIFDYIKLGSYIKERGGLTCRTTNQVLYKVSVNCL